MDNTEAVETIRKAAASAIQVDNGVAVKLWLTDDAVSVQLPRRLTWRELLSSRVQDVVLVDAETLEIDGSTFRIDPPDDAEDFFAGRRLSGHQRLSEVLHQRFQQVTSGVVGIQMVAQPDGRVEVIGVVVIVAPQGVGYAST